MERIIKSKALTVVVVMVMAVIQLSVMVAPISAHDMGATIGIDDSFANLN